MSGLIKSFGDISPTIAEDAFIAETAVVIGDVHIGAGASVWYGVTIRGDVNYIRVGAGTNIQDGTVVHVTRKTHPTIIGQNVTIGHMALLHGCTIQDEAFIGMGATVMDGVVVESQAMVAAGSLVTPGKVVKSGQLWGGSPARYMRDLTPEELAFFDQSAQNYISLGQTFRSEMPAKPS